MLRNLDSKRTKIVATLGPSSNSENVIRELIRAGMDVARINFSHSDHESHGKTIDLVRRIAEEEEAVVAILCDIQGPKIRIGEVENNSMPLKKGDTITLTQKELIGKDYKVSLPHPEFMQDLEQGTELMLDDGNMEFLVKEAHAQSVICEVVIGGVLKSNKGVAAPNAKLSLSAITPKDRDDIEFALNKETDYIAMSFVRKADDIRELRWLMKHLGKSASVVAKIEMREALGNIEEIIELCEGIMVARGDLGVEIFTEEVPVQQKRIIRMCNDAGKPVITATQMLESMTGKPRPTRAEASDVFNAIIDGTDAVMLSAESAAGKFPVRSVETMARIANIAEEYLWANQQGHQFTHVDPPESTERDGDANALSQATVQIADQIRPRAIVTTTMSGYTTQRVARERPRTPILCMTPNVITYRKMALVWGVIPLLIEGFNTIDAMLKTIVQAAYAKKLVDRDDKLIVIAGVPFGVAGQTNLLKIHTVGEDNEIPELD